MIKTFHHIERITGSVIEVKASDVCMGELARLEVKGEIRLAQVIRIDREKVILQVFGGTRGVSTSDKIQFLSRQMELIYSTDLLGRIFRGDGSPIDGKPSLTDGKQTAIGGPSVNPARRIIPRNMIRTNIPMIDVFNSLVESQKLPIFSIPGEPYNPLLARIALAAEADVIILGGMGLKYDDYLFFRKKFEEGGNLSRSVMFIHTAADPVVECLLIPDISLAAAEQFALEGKRVLVLLTDMTAFSDSLKEIAIFMEQIPSNRGYPGDLYSQLARRYEKAVDFEGAGSITVLAVTTMPGNDVTHPIPDNTGYITEGQFYLHGGKIDPFGSLSRLKQLVVSKVTREDHKELMKVMIQLYAETKQVQDKISMGFEPSTWDHKLLKYGEMFELEMMDLTKVVPLEEALDKCWEILGKCFSKEHIPLKKALVDKYWR
ncbi:MAG: V-type ATP synthase subunit B [Candidatus Coatesbacteria bacterium]|nr:V-type ATP synthase subunit B [Candidatus Coatesbacteria bacterium]